MRTTDAADLHTLSNAFELLGHERRLRAILCLRESEGRMPIRDLATEIAAAEQGSCPDEVSDETVTRVYISLLHTHLPRLYELNVVEYHRATEYVVFTNGSPAVETIMDTVADAYLSPAVETSV